MEAGGRGRTRQAWHVLVPLTALCAGLLFATSANTAQGTDLRAGRFSQLTDLIEATSETVKRREREAAALREQVAAVTREVGSRSSTVAAERSRGDAMLGAAGLQAIAGPGLRVVLDDAPRPPEGQPPASDNPDDLVVHQQDLQSVVNGLWAGGAEAVSLMGYRLISTSAVRCVGNTVVIQGRLFGPPFVIEAVGPVRRMQTALDEEPGVALFKRYVETYGVGYDVRELRRVRMPAYRGALDMPNVAAS